MSDENSMAERPLAELLVAVGGGDRDAFATLYQLTSPQLFGLAVRMMRHRAAAEEIIQEVYEQVWASAEPDGEWMSSPMGWLMMLTHRRVVDRIRAERAADGHESVSGRRHLDRDEDRAVLHFLDGLTPPQRECVALAYYSGLTYPEMAEVLGTPVATVKSHIRGGLRRLATDPQLPR